MLHLFSWTSCIDRQQQHTEAAASSGALLTPASIEHSSEQTQSTVHLGSGWTSINYCLYRAQPGQQITRKVTHLASS